MGERLRRFLRRSGGSAPRERRRRGAARVPRGLRGRAGALPARAGAARRRGGDPLRAFQRGRAARGGSRWWPRRRPTPCCRCWRPGRAGGCSSTPGSARTARRFGWDGGFWLPECAYVAGARVAAGRARACAGSASTRAPTSAAARRAGPGRPRPARWRCRSTGRRCSWLWSLDGYPVRPRPRPVRRQVAARDADLEGRRRPYDPAAAAERAARTPREFLAAVARPPRRHRAERGRRGLLVFAIDTELLGHWWSEGPIWLRGGARRAPRRPACGCSPLPQALAEHEPVERAARRVELGRGQGPRAPGTRPAVADLAWGARRLELRLLRALARRAARRRGRARRARAARGAGERLGLPRPARPGRRLRLPARHRRTPRRCSRP